MRHGRAWFEQPAPAVGRGYGGIGRRAWGGSNGPSGPRLPRARGLEGDLAELAGAVEVADALADDERGAAGEVLVSILEHEGSVAAEDGDAVVRRIEEGEIAVLRERLGGLWRGQRLID